MEMRFFVSAVVLSLAAAGLSADADYKWTGAVDNWNWNAPGNFDPQEVPAPGKTVELPNSTDVFVKDAVSLEIVSALDQIFPTDAKSRLIFDVHAGAYWTVTNCAICSAAVHKDSDWKIGEIVKRGPGSLMLARSDGYPGQDDGNRGSNVDHFAYYTDITCEEGFLRLPTSKETGGYSHCFGYLSVSNNAVIHTVSGDPTVSGASNYTAPIGIWGEGTFTNGCSVNHNFRQIGSKNEPCVFYGRLTGRINFMQQGAVALMGTNNSCYGINSYRQTINIDKYASVGTYCGVRKFGMLSECATFPPDAVITYQNDGGRYLCLSDEDEVTDRAISITRPKDGPVAFDAGHHGGLTLRGGIRSATGASYCGMGILIIAGTNAVPCVFDGPLASSGTNDIFYVKLGSGTWRFADEYNSIYSPHRTFGTTIDIREGTIQFDSMQDVGRYCALGLANDLAEPYYGARNNAAHATEFAYLAGAKGGAGVVLEFTGTNGAYATTRPLGLRGRTTLRNNTDCAWRFSGVKPTGADPVTLVLDASVDSESEIAGIDDTGKGALSVEKTGAGVWTLNGSNTIHGTICVKEGTLRINRVSGPYSWLKWSFRGRGEPDPNWTGNCYYSEIAVLDAEGNEVNKGIVAADRAYSIGKGQAYHWNTGPVYENQKTGGISGSGGIKNLFDGTSTAWETDPFDPISGNRFVHDPTKPNTWFPIVMRLKDDVGAPTRYDVMFAHDVSSDDKNCKRNPNSWQMEGSADGIHWDLLHEVTTNAAAYKLKSWYSNTNATSMTAHQTGAAPGFAFSRTMSQVPFMVLSNATVSVAKGATLEAVGGEIELPALALDATANGTIKGFTLAEEGILSVTGAESRQPSVPVTFEDCENLDNLPNWSVKIGERIRPGVTAAVGPDGEVKLSYPGIMLIVR